MRNPLDQCMQKFVVVEADGIRFFGTLIEVGEEEAILKTPNRWISVRVDKIASIREIDPAVLEALIIEDVDAEAYAIDSEPAGEPANAVTDGEDPV